MAVCIAKDHLDAAVSSPVFFEHRAHVRLGGSIIGDAEFPVGVELIEDRIKAAAEPSLPGIVHGNKHRDQRRIRHGGNGPLNFEPVLLVQTIQFKPARIALAENRPQSAWRETGLSPQPPIPSRRKSCQPFT